ncbi:LysM peptidoglycan-binding domain-containing protein [Cetobacterium sp.]|uniref:LysM peptidoglycan-binding domain-containing protein n=1 Tax=Cetobacterium sp. TaxID=2071632 RepID=UPI003F33854B
MYRLFGIFLIIGFTVSALEDSNNLEFKFSNKNLETLEILITSSEEVKEYIIQRGDTLTKIARKLNTSIEILAAKNNIKNIDLIYSDTKLVYKAIN